ncbi:MAG: PIG-L family deacetylase, partial [Proteobacteria bacterium]|nr:PIG-L family deacetylase [Pseudomonadota bacterium]
MQRVLVLAPHPEDGETGCGATMAKYLRAGKDVFYVAFTVAEKSTPPPFRPDEQKYELARATAILGLPEENVLVNHWEVRTFPEHRQEILDYLLELRREIKPDLV